MNHQSAEATAPARRHAMAGAVAALFLLAAPLAQAEGDVEAGKVKVMTCLGCHGSDGYKNVYPTYHVPKLVGLSTRYIATALRAYRDGSRQHPTMQSQGGSMTDQDIDDIAAYIGSLGE